MGFKWPSNVSDPWNCTWYCQIVLILSNWWNDDLQDRMIMGYPKSANESNAGRGASTSAKVWRQGRHVQGDLAYFCHTYGSETYCMNVDNYFCSLEGRKHRWGGCDHDVHWLSPLLPIPEVRILVVGEIMILSCKVFMIMLMFLIAREELRMKCKNLFYPPGLYKVIKLTFSQDFKDW